MESLQSLLQSYIAKNDYRFIGTITEAEASSWVEAVEAIVGSGWSSHRRHRERQGRAPPDSSGRSELTGTPPTRTGDTACLRWSLDPRLPSFRLGGNCLKQRRRVRDGLERAVTGSSRLQRASAQELPHPALRLEVRYGQNRLNHRYECWG
jgi:hypothetical protein